MEGRRRRRIAFEKTAKRMLRYLEDSEDVKVGVTELQEQLEISEEAGVSTRQIAQQAATHENGQKIFEHFRQGEEGSCIASLARWNAQLKGLVELERCRDTMQAVKLLSDRQEIMRGMVEGKIWL